MMLPLLLVIALTLAPDERRWYVAKIKEKIGQGLALAAN